MIELITFILGMFSGVGATLAILNYLEAQDKLKLWFKKRKHKLKVGQMWANYEISYPEYWIVEEYISLYQIGYIGKEYVRLNLIEDKHSSLSLSKTIDVRYEVFFRRYTRYKGTKDKFGLFEGTGV